jgi:hypothetical protein
VITVSSYGGMAPTSRNEGVRWDVQRVERGSHDR